MKKVDVLRKVVSNLKRKELKGKYSQEDVATIVETYSETVMDILKDDVNEEVPIFGLGRFTTKHIAEKERKNFLKGGEAYTSTAKDKLVFKPSASVKNVKEY